jgi:hypothetical protein
LPTDGLRPFAALTEAEFRALVPAPLTRAQVEAGALARAAFAAPTPRGSDGLRRGAQPLPHLACRGAGRPVPRLRFLTGVTIRPDTPWRWHPAAEGVARLSS